MNLISLILYGLVNILMVLACLLGGKGKIYESPFWVGILALGWFFPMSVGGYENSSNYPDNAYAEGMLFATFCTLALWGGFYLAKERVPERRSWLDHTFDIHKLVLAGAFLCVAGFFFQWKLNSLPEEMLAQTQWSGATVKYHFLASVFKIGFLILWLIYLNQKKWIVPRLLIFVVPSLLLMLEAAIMKGRRSGMMDLAAYVLISLWFVRRITMPRWIFITGLGLGLLIVNAVGTYRNIMARDDLSLSERLTVVSKTDFASESKDLLKESGMDFNNYIYFRQVYADEGRFNFGVSHWNGFVFNFVPAQVVSRETKNALMIPEFRPQKLANERYGHRASVGSVSTGYSDAFSSFGWFGFVKFLLIGWMMGVLYRHAMTGYFMAQLLYVYLLGTSMSSISHTTHTVLVSQWVYFFAFGYPVLYWAKLKPRLESAETHHDCGSGSEILAP